jgi:hypothetical protein
MNALVTNLEAFGAAQVPSKEAQIAKLTTVVLGAHAPLFKSCLAILQRGKDDKTPYDLDRHWTDLYLTEAQDASGDVWGYKKTHRDEYAGKSPGTGGAKAAMARSSDYDSDIDHGVDAALLEAYAMVAADQARKSLGARSPRTYRQAAETPEAPTFPSGKGATASLCNVCGGGGHIARQCTASCCVTCAVCKYKHRAGMSCPSPYHAERLAKQQQQKAAGAKAAVASNDAGALSRALKVIAALEKRLGSDDDGY